MPAHPRNKSLGVFSILLGACGILVGLEEVLAAVFAGGWGHGSGTGAALEQAKDGVLLVGGVLTVMSIWLLVTGILLVTGRGTMAAKVWGVFGVLVAIGLVLDAVSNQELVAELAKSRRFVYPGLLADLGGAKIPALGALALWPLGLLLGTRRPELSLH